MMEKEKTGDCDFRRSSGFTLIELLVVLAVFSVVMAGLYSTYSVSMREGVKQYKFAQSEMEYQISRSVIERDLTMAGYGIAECYCNSGNCPGTMTAVASTTCLSRWQCNDGLQPASIGLCVPVYVQGNGAAGFGTGNAVLTLMGTALGRDSRATQAWSYTMDSTPTSTADYQDAKPWADGREQLKTNDNIIYMDPNNKSLLFASAANSVTGKKWLFPYPGGATTNPYPTMADSGMIVLGLQSFETGTGGGLPGVPYYVVQYSIGGAQQSQCPNGVLNLMRLEGKHDPPTESAQPLINCVLDMQFAFGLDTNGDGNVDCWDNDGALAATYLNPAVRTQLKQVKMYVLVQEGARDITFTSASPIRVGDLSLTSCQGTGVGHNVTLTGDLLHYRWRVLSFDVAPRNIR